MGAELQINFTEPPRSNASRGGRHVECGIGLATGARIIVVGYRENIFHWLPRVEFCESWEAAKVLCSNTKLSSGGTADNRQQTKQAARRLLE